jgi:hypothetical protein
LPRRTDRPNFGLGHISNSNHDRGFGELCSQPNRAANRRSEIVTTQATIINDIGAT